MKKFLLIILVFLSLVALAIRFGAEPLMDYLGSNQRAGLRVEANKKSQVFIGDQLVGETPFQDENLKTGEVLVGVKPADATSAAQMWKGYVQLNNGTLSVINRELESQPVLSSGEVITLKKGSGVNVVSTPSEAMVNVDGKDYGRTPIMIDSLASGEHQFVLSRENYLKRSIRVTLVEGYQLTLAVDLAISEADLSKSVTIPQTQSSDVTVKQTPTGFLRMRDDATVNAKEVTRIAPGEKLTLIEEKTGWAKVRTKEGKEGWVSSAYLQK